MEFNEIERRLTEIFRDIFDNADIVITQQTTSADIDDWDSLANISLVITIEKEFKTKFSLAEIKALANVGDMINLIKAKVG